MKLARRNIVFFAALLSCNALSAQENYTIHAQEIQCLRGHTLPIWCLNYSLDGKFICSSGEDECIIIWDIDSGKKKKTLKCSTSSLAVLFLPDNDIVSAKSKVKLWSPATGKSFNIYDEDNAGASRGIALSPSGKLLAVGGKKNTLRLWEIETHKETAILEGHTGFISSVAFSPSGNLLASGSFDGTIRIWDVKRKKELACFSGYENIIRPILFFDEGKKIFSGSWDGHVKAWDITTNKLSFDLPHDDAVMSIALSPDNKLLATGCNKEIKIWMLKTKTVIASIKHSGMILTMAFSPDGKNLAVGGGNIFENNEPFEIKIYKISLAIKKTR